MIFIYSGKNPQILKDMESGMIKGFQVYEDGYFCEKFHSAHGTGIDVLEKVKAMQSSRISVYAMVDYKRWKAEDRAMDFYYSNLTVSAKYESDLAAQR